jgi:hypothetical protein
MSGYLQRLVSSAMKPTASVHPVIAPVFSMQHGAGNEDLAEPTAAGIAPLLSTPFEAYREPPATSANVAAISPTPSSVAAAVAPISAEDLSPPYSGRSVVELPEETRQKHAFTSGLRPARVEGVSTQSAYTPLLPETAGPLSAVEPHAASPLGPTSRPGKDADRVRNSPAKKREPDEIQITIGRIEVTAVPEAPARPAVKPGRKQISLDEYLRRADGRGR